MLGAKKRSQSEPIRSLGGLTRTYLESIAKRMGTLRHQLASAVTLRTTTPWQWVASASPPAQILMRSGRTILLQDPEALPSAVRRYLVATYQAPSVQVQRQAAQPVSPSVIIRKQRHI